MILLTTLTVLAIAAAIASVRVALRDGYRAVPTDPRRLP